MRPVPGDRRSLTAWTLRPTSPRAHWIDSVRLFYSGGMRGSAWLAMGALILGRGCAASRSVGPSSAGPQAGGPLGALSPQPASAVPPWSKPPAGSPCEFDGDFACAEDKRALLACQGSRWTLAQPCRGPGGCASRKNTLKCDSDIAEEGDACLAEDQGACATTGKSLLRCRGHRFVTASLCRGPQGCTAAADRTPEPACDTAFAAPGDPCEAKDRYSCGLDEKELVRCDGTRIVEGSPCAPSERCAIRSDRGASTIACRPVLSP